MDKTLSAVVGVMLLVVANAALGAEATGKAGGRAELLRAGGKSFSLMLGYRGEQDKPYYQLVLSVEPVVRFKGTAFDRYAQITEEQARKIIDYLATEGFLYQALDLSRNRAPAPPAEPYYAMTARAGEAGFEEWLGWDLRMLKRLDGLRAVLEGEAAKDMDLLLGRMSGHRREWEAAAEKPMPADFLKVESKAWASWLDEPISIGWGRIPLKDVLAGEFGPAAIAVDPPAKLETPITFDVDKLSRRTVLWKLGQQYGFAVRWEQKGEPKTFMGVPETEKQERSVGGVTITAMTQVMRADRGMYLESKRAGKVVKEEVIDGVLYFAVEVDRELRFDHAAAWVRVTERYKTGADAVRAMKGWELYVWQQGGETYYSLVVGTNRNKSEEEITRAAVKGFDAIKPRLDRLEAGEFITVSGRKRGARPPERIMREVSDYCRRIGLKT